MSGYDDHDYEDGNGYHQQCSCNKCKAHYDSWCRKNKVTGKSHCKIKKIVHYEVQCSQPVTTEFKWGYKTRKEVDWKPHKSENHPKKCSKCGHKSHHCTCKKH